jgi:hypothetical protein
MEVGPSLRIVGVDAARLVRPDRARIVGGGAWKMEATRGTPPGEFAVQSLTTTTGSPRHNKSKSPNSQATGGVGLHWDRI